MICLVIGFKGASNLGGYLELNFVYTCLLNRNKYFCRQELPKVRGNSIHAIYDKNTFLWQKLGVNYYKKSISTRVYTACTCVCVRVNSAQRIVGWLVGFITSNLSCIPKYGTWPWVHGIKD